MLSLSPSSIARSSLEQMLESLTRGDENEKPKDMPPALPTRPKPTSRARLPSTKRPLPTSFVVEEAELVDNSLNCDVKKEDVRRSRRNSFGGKRVKESEPEESPYFVVAMDQKQCKQELEEEDVVKVGDARKVPRFRESEWDGNVGYFAKKKLRVWCLLRNGLWELGVIQSTSEEKAFVLLSDKSVVTVPTHELLPANPDILEGVDDLIQLSYLNEPSVLYNLQYRYSQDIIYSKAGPVLVAVNPFKDVQLYGDECIAAYRQKLLHAPHVYAIADTAYNEMMTEQVSQSIIISGESGAGKTETAKIAMNYLASLGGGSNGIESNVLQTSCILEAFGNAKTARNDNSSRFGKLIEILFNASGKICSAQIQTFLLEKSRVVQLAQGERSYHIFYQLCAGAPSVIRERLRLKKACDYNYLNQSNCLEIHAVDDAQNFHALMDALDTVRICKDDQEHAFEMLAAVLWLGNISFITVGNESHVEVVADEAVTNSASLLGCSSQDLMLALSTRSIQAGKDKVAKRLKHQEAVDARDSLAKFIYASLFDWLVEKLNESLGTGKQHSGRSISILDIYGFESFKKNSFEQFCINYANERLQQHFNRHLFKLQQEEYEQDGIDWTKVEFTDNQDCLDLFEKKPLGLISLLDEESNFPKATSLTFATKLKQHLAANQCFKAEHGGAFSVHHYAGEVTYDTGEFLEKNRDPLYSETVQLLFSCTNELPRLFASALMQSQKTGNPSSHLGMLARQKQSVATKFKGQLFQLMQWLESTRPHFIRCIKPNSKQIPGAFNQDLVLEQLKSCGILEVVRISRSGYPTRMPHQEFTRRYGFLLQENNACQDPLSTSVAILQQFDIQPETYQVGYTRLYFRAGQIGALEDIRKQFMQGTLEVQKFYRGHRARRYFHEVKKCVVTLQSYVRGEIARKEFGILLGLNKQVISGNLDQQVMAVVQIQSVMRGWAARRYFSHLRNPSQSNARKTRPRRRVSELKELPPEMLPSVVEELEKRVRMAEETLGRKEKENTALRDQVVQFETRWLEYEAKMKSMEEMWQKQIKSLQVSLAAAKKSLGTENNTNQHGQFRGAQSPHSYNSENVSAGTHSPNCSGTPFRSFLSNGGADLLGGRGGTNGVSDVVSPLVREFEERKHNFDEEALAITEGKSGISASMNLVEEFRRLKRRFEAWKKDYKVRLREAKVKVQRMGASEADKHRRNWWGKKSIRF